MDKAYPILDKYGQVSSKNTLESQGEALILDSKSSFDPIRKSAKDLTRASIDFTQNY